VTAADDLPFLGRRGRGELSIQTRTNRGILSSHLIMKGDRLGEFEELTLLAIRALGDHTYAVPIQQYVEKATGRPISVGSIYAALARLEEKRFVRSAMSEAEARRGGKSKRVYTVTPSGLRTARELHRVRERIWNAIAEGGRS